jgi:CRISPR-associated protein Cmr4
MTLNSRLYGLRADTAIHAGTGVSDGKVDLPIMREHHSGWPVVFGSAVKGALRATAELKLGKTSDPVKILFGPDTQNAGDHAGALLVADARLLALPVRSLTSQYRLVTCPGLVQRLQQDADRYGVDVGDLTVAVNAGEILVATAEKNSHLFLEDYAYKCNSETKLDALIAVMAKLADTPVDSIREKIAVVSNDDFAHICSGAIPVQAHIALDSATKTVTKGALWYEESLPADTLMYLGVSSWSSRHPSIAMSSEECLAQLDELIAGQRPYLQVGGNETTGMGWCKVTRLAGLEG